MDCFHSEAPLLIGLMSTSCFTAIEVMLLRSIEPAEAGGNGLVIDRAIEKERGGGA